MPWVNGAMGPAVRFIGTAVLLGAIGLILPSALRIAPWLTLLAALGLTTTMLGAAATRLARGEAPFVALNAVLGGLAVFVAWGCSRPAPIPPRSGSPGAPGPT
jgi:hypothetical protein